MRHLAQRRVREGSCDDEVAVERNCGEVEDRGHPEENVEELRDAHEFCGDRERALDGPIEVEIHEGLYYSYIMQILLFNYIHL